MNRAGVSRDDHRQRRIPASAAPRGRRTTCSTRSVSRPTTNEPQSLTHNLLARFHPELIHEHEEWEVLVETESEDDLPDLLSILYEQLHAPNRSLDVFFNGEPYSPNERP